MANTGQIYENMEVIVKIEDVLSFINENINDLELLNNGTDENINGQIEGMNTIKNYILENID